MKHTLVIVDDHSIIRSGLQSYFEAKSDWRVVQTTENPASTLEYLEKCSPEELPEIIIFDIQLAGEMSFRLIQEVSQKYPQIKSIAFTMFDTTGFILAAKECGVRGFITKTQSEAELLECLAKEKSEKISLAEHHMAQLTRQQRRVYQEILMGRTNEEIADSMDLKLHSVEIYITRIYEKLGIFSRDDILKVR